jgi:PhnB protein
MAATTVQESAVQEAIQRRNAALSAKDVAAVMATGAAGFVSYSLAPPLQSTGGAAGMKAWFSTWDGPIGLDVQGLEVVASEDVAFAHGFFRMSGRKTDGSAADLWFRQTFGLTRSGETWKIAHEHSSVPFLMDGSFRAAVDLKP